MPFLLSSSDPPMSHLCPAHPPLLWLRPVALILPKLSKARGAVCRWHFNLERRMSASEGRKGESSLLPLQTLWASLGSALPLAPLIHPLPTRTPPLESHQVTRITLFSSQPAPNTALPPTCEAETHPQFWPSPLSYRPPTFNSKASPKLNPNTNLTNQRANPC